jgi:hypothetical protein
MILVAQAAAASFHEDPVKTRDDDDADRSGVATRGTLVRTRLGTG